MAAGNEINSGEQSFSCCQTLNNRAASRRSVDFIHALGGLSCNVAHWPAPFALSTKQLRFAKRTT